jgi:uroporphyrinogen-III synthase
MGEGLAGRRVVVTRASGQVGRLSELLVAEGAEVIEVPTITVVDPADGGETLRTAMRDLWDWVVVTSPNGAERAVAAAGGRAAAHAVRWAVVGPGTADALGAHGIRPALVPDRFVAEGLLDAFPRPPADGRGRVLVAQAENARPVLVDGLRAAGWEVSAVVAYRTVPVTPPPEQLAAAASADAVLFTSGSTVDAFVRAVGTAGLPPSVVVIGPVTAEAARRHGLAVAAVASPHSLEGLVAATMEALA